MEKVKILPPQSVIGESIQLSVCDAYLPKVWVLQCHFWRLKDSTTHERVFHLLQESLRRTVAEIPALAGTTSLGPTGDPRDMVLTIGTNAHVEFSCEDLTQNDAVPPYEKIEEEGFPMTGLVVPFAPPIALVPVTAGSPTLLVKLNYLKRGLALVFAFNHLFLDASGIAEVERIWASHTADITAGKEQTYRMLTPDLEIRKRLSTSVPDAGEFDDPYWKEFPADKCQLHLPKATDNAQFGLTMVQKELAKSGRTLEETKWVWFYFSPENLAKLKTRGSESNGGSWVSTIDALVGFIWSHLSALHADVGDGEISSLLFPINFRTRISPPVHSQYIGNCVDVVFTSCPLAQLTGDSGLQAGAQCIRKAVSGWSASAWQAWLNRAIALPPSTAIVPNPYILLNKRNVAFNDYSKSQSNTLDWGADLGQIGRTRYMKPATSLANCNTAVIIHPRLPNGGLEVAMSCNAHVQHSLETDKDFTAYCTRTCVSE